MQGLFNRENSTGKKWDKYRNFERCPRGEPLVQNLNYLLEDFKLLANFRVWDPSSDVPQLRGKQVKRPHSIWYTSVTSIWQTVWIEGVPKTYIALPCKCLTSISKH